MNGNISFEVEKEYVGSGDFRDPGYYTWIVKSITLTEIRTE